MVSRVIQLSVGVGVVALVVGRSNYYIWGMLVVVQRFLLSSWGFYDLIMADVIDNDRVLHSRTKSVSTSVHGVHSLIVKPAQSLAPMVGIWMLTMTGLQKGSGSGSSSGTGTGSGVGSGSGVGVGVGSENVLMIYRNDGSLITSVDGGVDRQRSGIYYLTFGLPLVVSLLQLFVWSKWTLKNNKLDEIKKKLKDLM